MAPIKYNEEFVKIFLSELGCKLISEYKNVKIKFRYRCSCGEESESTFDSFKNQGQKGCNKCGGKRANQNNVLTYEFVKNYFEEQAWQLLEKEYINSGVAMMYICNCGEKSKISWNNFRKGQRCKKCATKKNTEKSRIPYEEVEKFFSKHGFALLSEDYISMHSNLEYICICGKQVSKTYSSFKNSPKCNCNKNTGAALKRKYTKEDLIEYFWKYYNDYGKYPTPSDLKSNNEFPSSDSYTRKWGSYKNFLVSIGVKDENGWFVDDLETLKKYYHTNNMSLINELLISKRSNSTIRHVANHLGLKVSFENRYNVKDYTAIEIIGLVKNFVEFNGFSPTQKQFASFYPDVPNSTFRRLFGKWNALLRQANVPVNVVKLELEDEDFKLMIEMYKQGIPNKEIAQHFGFQDDSKVIYYLKKSGVALKNHRWSEEEITYLIKNYSDTSLKEMLDFLSDVTLEDLFRKASQLNLKRSIGNNLSNIEKYNASDGTVCLSRSEYKIHEILIANDVETKKEVFYKDIFKDSNYGRLRCDWLIRDKNIIVEYFGMNSPEYKQKTKRKIIACELNGFPIIDLYHYDLLYGFRGLKKKFAKHNIELLIPEFISNN